MRAVASFRMSVSISYAAHAPPHVRAKRDKEHRQRGTSNDVRRCGKASSYRDCNLHRRVRIGTRIGSTKLTSITEAANALCWMFSSSVMTVAANQNHWRPSDYDGKSGLTNVAAYSRNAKSARAFCNFIPKIWDLPNEKTANKTCEKHQRCRRLAE